MDLKFTPQEIVKLKNNALCFYLPVDVAAAKALFDAGLREANITQRVDYARDYGPRVLEHNLFMLLLQGSISLEVNNKAYTLAPKDIFYCSPKSELNKIVVNEPSWWIYFYFLDRPLWRPLHKAPCYFRKYESPEMMYLLFNHILSSKEKQTTESVLHSNESASSLLGLLRREFRSLQNAPDKRSLALGNLVTQIAAAPQDNWSATSMAKQINVSERQLTRLFQKEYGISPMAMVIRRRLNEASKQLIYTSKTIEAIALDLNYQSFHTFSTLFKKHIGMPPSEFRKNHRNEEMKSRFSKDQVAV